MDYSSSSIEQKRKLEFLANKKKKSKASSTGFNKDDPSCYGSDGELLPCFGDDFVEEDEDGPQGYRSDDEVTKQIL
jgi:hypothetical protein